MKNRHAYPDSRTWRELRAACLERANQQCEYVYPNGKRCRRTDGELRKSRHSGRKYIVYLHAAHSANACPDNPNPELICLCPAHHLKMDRALEAQDRVSQRRRGYRMTTTDSLLVEICDAGIQITEASDGYHWSLPHLGLGGHATTAARAAGCALYQLRIDLEKHKRSSNTPSPEQEPPMTMTVNTSSCQTPQAFASLTSEHKAIVAHIGCAENHHTFAWASQQALTHASGATILLSLCANLLELHQSALEIADEVVVLNLAGHVDGRTLHEVCAAYNQKKPITWMEPWPMYCPACRCTGLEAEHFFHNALSLRDLNDLFEALSREQLAYLDGQLADWYGQIVPVVMMPDGYPALQVDLTCTHCNRFVRTAYAIAGDHGAWTTLLEADGAYLADLCDADLRVQVLSCPDVVLQAQREAEVRDGN